MEHPACLATLLLAFFLPIAAANAQTVYRCGNTYSQTPCPGGTSIETQDERSRSQKSQADEAIKRDGKAAEALEKSRLKQETANSKSSTVAKSKTSSEKSSTDTDAKSTATQKKKPEYFTAKTTTEPKKKGAEEKGK